MQLHFYAYRDDVRASPSIEITGENLDSYASVHLTLWHLNIGSAIAKTRQCGNCGAKTGLFNRCECERASLG